MYHKKVYNVPPIGTNLSMCCSMYITMHMWKACLMSDNLQQTKSTLLSSGNTEAAGPNGSVQKLSDGEQWITTLIVLSAIDILRENRLKLRLLNKHYLLPYNCECWTRPTNQNFLHLHDMPTVLLRRKALTLTAIMDVLEQPSGPCQICKTW